MSNQEKPASRTVVVERELKHPAAKVWRALTESSLLGEWLMANDFAPVVGHKFNLRSEPRPHWNGVLDCEVLELVPEQRLRYSWNASGDEAGTELRTIVTFTLTPTSDGVLLRVEQSGFRPDEENNYRGAIYGWGQVLLPALDRALGSLS